MVKTKLCTVCGFCIRHCLGGRNASHRGKFEPCVIGECMACLADNLLGDKPGSGSGSRPEPPSPNTPQPSPLPNPGEPAVWDLVMADIRERDAIGTKKYGVRLTAGDGRDTLIDMYQELLDLIVYTRKLIREREMGWGPESGPEPGRAIPNVNRICDIHRCPVTAYLLSAREVGNLKYGATSGMKAYCFAHASSLLTQAEILEATRL